MLSGIEILNELEGKGLKPVGLPVQNPDKPQSYLIFIERSYDQDGNAVPSKRRMDLALKHLADKGVEVSVALLDEKATELDRAVGALLSENFSDAVESSVLSLGGKESLASISLSEGVGSAEVAEIEKAIIELLGLHGIANLNFIFSTPRPKATVTAVIGMLRKHAPVGIEELGRRLSDAGFEKPTEAWMEQNLDRWRETGLLFRRSDGLFILTSAALCPSSGFLGPIAA